MKTYKKLQLVFGSLLMMALTSQISVAQTYHLSNTTSTLKVEGTSNIHDWDIIAEDQKGTLIAELDNGQLVKISQLDFTVKAESLKSGKSGMDKNTYKALKTDKYKQITYRLTKVNNIDCTSTGKCKVTTSGTLTIAGIKKTIDITFDATVRENKIILVGKKKLIMSEYGIDPPTAVFGTITTGDALNIKFESNFIQ